jgi:hypothetical protein
MPTLGGGIESAGHDIGRGLAVRIAEEHKKRERIREVQGLLDAAKQLTITDPKTGKAKPFVPTQNTDAIQRLLDMGNVAAAAKQEAFYGIGKDLYLKARQAEAQAAISPYQKHEGRRYLVNPKTGAVKPDIAVPRSEFGVTAHEQFGEQMRLRGAQARQLAAEQKGIDTMLKPYKLTRGDLFDVATHEHGTLEKGKFVPKGEEPQGEPTVNKILQAVMPGGYTGPLATPAPQATVPTHVRVGFRPGEGKDPGSTGAIVTRDQLEAWQDEAARVAPPIVTSRDDDGNVTGAQSPFAALQWLRSDAAAKQPELADKVRKQLTQAVTQGAARTVQPKVDITVEGGSSTTPAPEPEPEEEE